MELEQLQALVVNALGDMKARDVKILDVRGVSTITELMIIATGTSTRHVRSIAENVGLEAKRAGEQPLGTEGDRDSDWVLVDLNDIVVHVMLPETRDFYNLEKLWGEGEFKDQLATPGGSR
uniref:Ribosomal silencing factor RsfS n=1 Tax=uncultured Thiotrichaceae bacterium TaxID=298394 RepID=A0A6S6T7B9_9GAMM|nr:MAG: Ribosomal silencing factor RsfA (former Iojap) [uncultured Thiotrichaceae bacterium]